MRSYGYRASLHRLACITSFATWILICAGALVTSTESGLAVPDWPLSYGQLFPPMVGGVRFEHSHRMIAGIVLILTVWLAVMLNRTESRRWVRRAGVTALVLVLVQAALGGITVIYLLPPPVSILHAVNAQSFFFLTVVLAYVTSRSWLEQAADGSPGAAGTGTPFALRILVSMALTSVFIQLIAGAMRRHKLVGLMPHLVGAVLVTVCVLALFVYVSRTYANHNLLLRTVRLLSALVVTEVFLGAASWFARARDPHEIGPALVTVVVTVAHVGVGAAVFASTAVLLLIGLRMHKYGLTPNTVHSA